MKRRGWVLIALGAIVAIVVSAWINAGKQRYPGDLDPRNPQPNGGQAVARVLEDEGVEVSIARGAEEFEATAVGMNTLVVVTSTDQLGKSTTAALLHHAEGAQLLVIDPGPDVVQQLGYSGQAVGVEPERAIAGDCPAFEGLSIDVELATGYRITSNTCFESAAGASLAPVRGSIFLFGAPGVLENRQILKADNAAVALRLLGSAERLVWYVPSATDLIAGDEVSLNSFLPPWLRPGLWVVGLTTIGLVLWRGRRLGPLATEPLPVTVKAIETTQSRGRLYRKAQDRAHAASSLRQAAVVRLCDRLRLPHDVAPTEAATAVAGASGRPFDSVNTLLYGAPPTTDRDLIQLATELADLDDDLRKAPR